jgi:hypothetical protein
MSHKCGDMEKLIPSLLGVSKPILDLVIFCHQVCVFCVICCLFVNMSSSACAFTTT